jgi:hypothetical protein
MQVVNLISDSLYFNLYTLTGYTQGQTLIVHNNTPDPLFISQASLQPAPTTSLREFIDPGATSVVYSNGLPIWIRGSVGPILVSAITERVVLPLSASDLPHDFYTSPKELYRRIKVDPGQTSFHDGREFRTFYEFSIAALSSVWFRVTVGVDTILYDVNLTVDAGSVRLRTFAGGTPVGVYGTPLPIIPKNTMSIRSTPIYPSSNSISTGGTGQTGGVNIDIVRVVAANATAQQSSVGSKAFDQRGVGAGTYYWQIENFSNGTATGVFSGFWAEILNLGV